MGWLGMGNRYCMGMGMGRWTRERDNSLVLMSGMRNAAVPGLACVCLSVCLS